MHAQDAHRTSRAYDAATMFHIFSQTQRASHAHAEQHHDPRYHHTTHTRARRYTRFNRPFQRNSTSASWRVSPKTPHTFKPRNPHCALARNIQTQAPHARTTSRTAPTTAQCAIITACTPPRARHTQHRTQLRPPHTPPTENHTQSHTRPPRHTHVRAVRLPTVDGMLPESWLPCNSNRLQDTRTAIASQNTDTQAPHARTTSRTAPTTAHCVIITTCTPLRASHTQHGTQLRPPHTPPTENHTQSHTPPPRHTHSSRVRLPSVDGMLPDSWLLSKIKCLQDTRSAIASHHGTRRRRRPKPATTQRSAAHSINQVQSNESQSARCMLSLTHSTVRVTPNTTQPDSPGT
jgi:hypothetical protein